MLQPHGERGLYAYDPLGRRTHKSGTGVTETYFLDDGDDEIAEYSSTGTLTRRFVPGPAINEPIAMVTVSSGLAEYYHTDHHGSVVATSRGDNGNIRQGPVLYDAYGNCFVGAAACTTLGATANPFLYTGMYLDQETGLFYDRARYYSSTLGRFAQTDPVGYKDDLNLYTYVGNDPLDGIDPLGLAVLEFGVEADGYLIMGVTYGFGVSYDTVSGNVSTTGKFGVGFGLEGSVGVTAGLARSGPSGNFGSINVEGSVPGRSAEVEVAHFANGKASSGIMRGNAEKELASDKQNKSNNPALGFGGHVDLQVNFERKSTTLTDAAKAVTSTINSSLNSSSSNHPVSPSRSGLSFSNLTDKPGGKHLCTGSNIGTTQACD